LHFIGAAAPGSLRSEIEGRGKYWPVQKDSVSRAAHLYLKVNFGSASAFYLRSEIEGYSRFARISDRYIDDAVAIRGACRMMINP
jgi:hypothetical protein